MFMKKILFILGTLLIVITFSCKSNDFFVGRWVKCDDPSITVTIEKSGDKYHVTVKTSVATGEIIMEKQANELISGQGQSLMYDQLTHHISSSEDRQPLCKVD